MKSIKLFETFEAPGFHSSFCTTFDVDFGAYESVALSRLRNKGCTNNVLLADSRMLTYALDGRSLPAQAGTRYSVVGIAPARQNSVFHPKLVLKLGEKTGCLLVASANMTSAGLGGNLEVVGQVSSTDPDSPEAGLLRTAFDYLLALLPPDAHVAREQFAWAKRRAPWLDAAVPVDAIFDADGKVQTQFLAHSAFAGIGARFLSAIGGEPIRRLVVVSPFWDKGLEALSWLQEALHPEETALLLQREAALFPKKALGPEISAQIYPMQVGKGTKGKASRFMHAKVVIAQSSDADHVLYGSTNCTTAALGNALYVGGNQEASLYRRLAPGQAIELLGLSTTLEPQQAVSAHTLPELGVRDEIPLEECRRRSSGSFELENGILSWQRPQAQAGVDGKFEFCDAYGFAIQVGATLLTDDGERATFALEEGAFPSFACLAHDGELFAPSVVLSMEALQFARLPAAKSAYATKLEYFEDPETVENLKFYSLLAEFIQLDHDAAAAVKAGIHATSKDAPAPQTSQALTYEEFILRRAATPQVGLASSSTGTGYSDAVRQALNRMVGVRSKSLRKRLEEESSDVLQIDAILNVGDETANREQAIETGSDASRNLSPEQLAASKKQATIRKLQSFRQTQKAIEKTAQGFIDEERAATQVSHLKPVSLLKLRVLLAILLSTGCTSENLEAKTAGAQRRVAALLPCRGHNSWPQLVGQLLYEFFRWRSSNSDTAYPPLISEIEFPDQDGGARLPVDVAECLFMCQWAVQAIGSGVDDKDKPVAPPSRNMAELRADVYTASRNLLGNDLEDALREQTWEGLDNRYGEQLGVDAKKIRARHQETLRALNAPALA